MFSTLTNGMKAKGDGAGAMEIPWEKWVRHNPTAGIC